MQNSYFQEETHDHNSHFETALEMTQNSEHVRNNMSLKNSEKYEFNHLQ